MVEPRSPEAVDKLLRIASTGGLSIGSAEDRAEDVGGIVHFEHIQLYVRKFPTHFHVFVYNILQSTAIQA